MAKYKVINVDLYRRDITVFIGSHDEFKDWVISIAAPASWEQLIEAISYSDDDSIGSYWYNINNGNGIIELPKHPKTPEEIATATHEALHATFRLLDYVGVEYMRNGSNEPFTYTLEYIVNGIMDFKGYEFINKE